MLEIDLDCNSPKLQVKSLHINSNAVIIGPSGAGKTTLIRCIAGLNSYNGKVLLDGRELKGCGPSRQVSIAWQDKRLLPNFTLRQNIELGGNSSNLEHFAKIFKISELLDKKPFEVSEGECQRANILRAICSNSRVVLFDEPMQGIDSVIVRKTLKKLLYELNKVDKIALFVTHELYQVYGLFDDVIVIKSGEVVERGNFQTLYETPSSPWLAHFFGPYTVLNKEDLKSFDLHSNEDPCMIRPEWFKIKIQPHKDPSEFNATVTGIQWNGPTNRVSLRLNGINGQKGTNKPLVVELNTDQKINKGDKVYVNYKKCSRPSWING